MEKSSLLIVNQGQCYIVTTLCLKIYNAQIGLIGMV